MTVKIFDDGRVSLYAEPFGPTSMIVARENAEPPTLRVWPPKERARRRPDPIKLRRARKGKVK